ncbi:MAG TPA: L,D-transpeptidase [Bauldia sp.]|nr:L,D-transpeptidase [Bauldia sp.]
MRRIMLAALAAAALVAGVASASAKIIQTYDPQTGKISTIDTDMQYVAPGGHAYSPIPRQTISYDGPYGPNTIVINTTERRLYYVMDNGQAIKYGIGVGREGFTWAGTDHVSRKAEWPGWTPPAVMIAREAAKGRKLPAYMKGGPGNPLGARALYIGARIYRIHGTAEPWTIGQAVSSGCIRLVNDDVIDLYDRVAVGTKVVVLN